MATENENTKSESGERRIKKRVLIPIISAVLVVVMAAALFVITNVSQRKMLDKMLTEGSWVNMTDDGITVLKFDDGRAEYKMFTLDKNGDYNDNEGIRFAYKIKSTDRFAANGKNYNVKQTEEGMEINPGLTNGGNGSEKWVHVND